MNVLIQRCKEMPRKREPEGRPKMFNTLPSDIAKQEAYLHANPPKGIKKNRQKFHFTANQIFWILALFYQLLPK